MFGSNYMKRECISFNVSTFEDESDWLQLDKVYPGIFASETLPKMRPHERESFLLQCRDWYKLHAVKF